MDNRFNLIPIDMPADLLAHVQGGVVRARARRRLMYRTGAIAATIASVAGFVGAMIMAVQAFVSSNAGAYLSLVISDSATMVRYWREALSAVAEALPVGMLAVTLAFGLLTIITLRALKRSVTTTTRQLAY